MQYPPEMMLISLLATVTAAAIQMAAMVAAASTVDSSMRLAPDGGVIVTVSKEDSGIVGNTVLRSYCIAGSLLGGMASLAFWPIRCRCSGPDHKPQLPSPSEVDIFTNPASGVGDCECTPQQYLRAISKKMLISIFLGIVVAPITVAYVNLDRSIDTIWSISALLAFGGERLLSAAIPWAVHAFVETIKKGVSKN